MELKSALLALLSFCGNQVCVSVKFKLAFCGIPVCVKRIKFVFLKIQVCIKIIIM